MLMRVLMRVWMSGLLLWCWGLACAALPEGGVDLLGITEFPERESPGVYRFEPVAVADQPFTQAVRVSVLQRVDAPWNVALTFPVPVALNDGDVLALRLHARCEQVADETGSAAFNVHLERAGGDYAKLLSAPVSVQSTWREIVVPCEVAGEWPAGSTHVTVHGGVREQVFDLAAIELLRFPAGTRRQELPDETSYRRAPADAPWLVAAHERIARLRMADLSIRVQDRDGAPIPQARVHVRQLAHAFRFGSTVNNWWYLGRAGNEPRDASAVVRYRAELARNFNTATPENAQKWRMMSYWGADIGMEMVRQLVDAGMRVHGHVLVWPSWKRTPESLQALADQPDALRAACREHVIETTRRYAGMVVDWDVVNEPFANHDIMDVCGPEVMVEWFQLAAEHDPRAQLFINDYGILSDGNLDSGHHRHFRETIAYLLEQGAPLQGIGMQSHFGRIVTEPEQVLRILDRYAAFGVPLQVTEFDHATDDQTAQADYMHDFLTACFSHPSMMGFIMWGFWDGAHWKNNAPMFTQDWELKPSGAVWRELVFERWWTDETHATDATGSVTTRGFKGRYEVVVWHEGRRVVREAVLNAAGLELRVTLP